MVEDGAVSHKIDYVPFFRKILISKRHQNLFIGSKVMASLVSGGILPRHLKTLKLMIQMVQHFLERVEFLKSWIDSSLIFGSK